MLQQHIKHAMLTKFGRESLALSTPHVQLLVFLLQTTATSAALCVVGRVLAKAVCNKSALHLAMLQQIAPLLLFALFALTCVEVVGYVVTLITYDLHSSARSLESRDYGQIL